jgi:hypothetical protein
MADRMKHGNAATVSRPPEHPITIESLRKPLIAASGAIARSWTAVAHNHRQGC